MYAWGHEWHSDAFYFKFGHFRSPHPETHPGDELTTEQLASSEAHRVTYCQKWYGAHITSTVPAASMFEVIGRSHLPRCDSCGWCGKGSGEPGSTAGCGKYGKGYRGWPGTAYYCRGLDWAPFPPMPPLPPFPPPPWAQQVPAGTRPAIAFWAGYENMYAWGREWHSDAESFKYGNRNSWHRETHPGDSLTAQELASSEVLRVTYCRKWYGDDITHTVPAASMLEVIHWDGDLEGWVDDQTSWTSWVDRRVQVFRR